MLCIHENPQGVVFKVFIQPRSSKNMISGLHGDAIKIKLTAPPVDGAANKMCIDYLAKCLMVPKSSLEIIAGLTSRNKQMLLRYKDEKASKSEQQHLKSLIESLLT
ncbi:MAG: YggU family protein [Desulfobacterales bacterium]|nr:YggU family protein [Desulfobacterales bacterium]